MSLSNPNRIVVQFICLVGWVLLATVSNSEVGVAQESSAEADYTRTINARSHAIVEQLNLSDAAQTKRVEQTVADQYRGLREIHDSRDLQITTLNGSPKDQDTPIDQLIERVHQDSKIKQFQLHRSFIANLSAELNPEQVNSIKDGMTYGVLPTTYARYLQTLPNLTEEEKRTIMEFLFEAREYAMDAGSSDEKHGWFRKYKGKINNYLSSAGYKM